MSGRIKLLKIINYRKIKHDHILINLSNKSILIFNDPRKFGFIDFSITSELQNKKYLLKLIMMGLLLYLEIKGLKLQKVNG